MQNREQEIIAAIDRYKEATGLAYATIGYKINKEPNIHSRLKGGGGCNPKTYKKIMEWFAKNMKN